MATYYIGLLDGNRELCVAAPAIEPAQAPFSTRFFANAGATTELLANVSLLLVNEPRVRFRVDGTGDGTQILPTVVVSGSLVIDLNTLTTDRIVPLTAVLPGAFVVTTSIQGSVYLAPLLLGTAQSATIPVPTADLLGEYDNGRRPILPWRVAKMNVAHIYEVTENNGTTYKFDELEPFVVSDQFSNDIDDALTRAGGLAGYIGVVIDAPVGQALRFRPPYEGETVVLATDNSVWRWSTATARWEAHTTLPQRALNNVSVFQLLDADGIYDFYAKTLGLMLAQLQYDSRRIADLLDPVTCPPEFLSLLLNNFGADDFEFEETPEGKRELLRTFMAMMRAKGTPISVITALRALGYSGYATHVWAKPTGDPTDIIEKPFSYDQAAPTNPATDYYPTTQVNIHLAELDNEPLLVIDSVAKERVARFLRRNILPSNVFIKWFVSDRTVGTDNIAITDSLTVTTV